jgi:hypothetical protein
VSEDDVFVERSGRVAPSGAITSGATAMVGTIHSALGSTAPTPSLAFRWVKLSSGILAFFLGVQTLAFPAGAANFTFNTGPRKISMRIGNRPFVVTASGIVSASSRGHNEYLLSLRLDADLSDIQQHVTGLLRSQLDKEEPCGDRITIERAALIPDEPSVRAVIQLNYERYACVKLFGKRRAEKLIAGNGMVQVKFTPFVEDQRTLRLVPEVESIQASGSLGQLLRTGSIGATVRDKISKALLSAMERGADPQVTLPAALQNVAAINRAQFDDEGSGHLGFVLAGRVVISSQQVQLIKNKLKGRLPVS